MYHLDSDIGYYDIDLTAYIGTSDTDFTRSISLPADSGSNRYVMLNIIKNKNVVGYDDAFFQNTWDKDADASSEKIAAEVQLS